MTDGDRIGTLAVLGLGLIGGSLAAALKARSQVGRVLGWGRSEASLARGAALGHIDDYSLDLAQVLTSADVVVIATPTLVTEKLLATLIDDWPAHAVITDVASVKGNLLDVVRARAGVEPPNLVLAHPIAGSERSGVDAARAELFVDHRVILTPTRATDPAALARVRGMWSGVGAEVVDMDVARHDAVLAATSHLPHALAYTLVNCLSKQDSQADIFRFAAGGFRDFTRIASSDPQMWHDISLANSAALLDAIDAFSAELAQLKRAIAARDGGRIMAQYTAAKASRDRFAQGEFAPAGCGSNRHEE